MAIEVVEVQVRVEDGDPRVNTRGLVMVGTAAGRNREILSPIIVHPQQLVMVVLCALTAERSN